MNERKRIFYQLLVICSVFLSTCLPVEARMVCTNYNGKRMCQMQDPSQIKFDLYKCMQEGKTETACINEAKIKAFKLSEKLDRVVTVRFTQSN